MLESRVAKLEERITTLEEFTGLKSLLELSLKIKEELQQAGFDFKEELRQKTQESKDES